ncbi:hypothetical protein CDAR_48371 [Caerostris darwini]|uniref:Uncharacterized protein n=1 Tax=Caerostris darwini TaxID=1538125 RepID=A0AAV4W1H6_9ARAC|nr:hypothetical protein CDAR_48371 [Caerostris darwini]
MLDLLTIRQMDARGNGKFIRNYFLAFQSVSQTRKERSSKQRVPIRIKRCGTSDPLSPRPYWTDSICVFEDRKAFGRAIVDWRTIPLKFSFGVG